MESRFVLVQSNFPPAVLVCAIEHGEYKIELDIKHNIVAAIEPANINNSIIVRTETNNNNTDNDTIKNK
jgi:hypothetical protein